MPEIKVVNIHIGTTVQDNNLILLTENNVMSTNWEPLEKEGEALAVLLYGVLPWATLDALYKSLKKLRSSK